MRGADTQVSKLFVVELHTRGWAVGISKSPEERVLTTFFRLSRKQKNRLHYLKVKFYRLLDREKVFMLAGKYVVSLQSLPTIEKGFTEIEREFKALRQEFYEEITANWDAILPSLQEVARRLGIDPDELERLKPRDEDFLDMHYTVTPLPTILSEIYRTYEDFQRLAKQRDEYAALARRVKLEADKMIAEVRREYEKKLEEAEKLVEKLRGELKEARRKAYRKQLERMIGDASLMDEFLGDEAEDLRFRLETLKEAFTR